MVVGCLPYVAFCERKRDGRSEVGLVVWGRGSGVRIQGHSRNLFGHEKHKKSQKLTTHLRGGGDTQGFLRDLQDQRDGETLPMGDEAGVGFPVRDSGDFSGHEPTSPSYSVPSACASGLRRTRRLRRSRNAQKIAKTDDTFAGRGRHPMFFFTSLSQRLRPDTAGYNLHRRSG